MKQKRLFFLTAAIAFVAFLFSCSQSEVFDNVQEQPVLKSSVSVPLTRSESIALAVERKGTYLISESEAHDKLVSFVSSDRSFGANQIRSTTLKKNPSTGKSLYYEVVFDNGKSTGFSLVSADERIPEVLCFSESGSISDTTFNKSLKFCLQLVKRYVEEQIKEDLDIETLVLSANEKLSSSGAPINSLSFPFCLAYLRWEDYPSERVRQVPGGWHQTYPYNEGLPPIPGIFTSNGRAYVGCAMIAVSQIMAYHKKDFKYYITSAMWPGMIANPYYSTRLHSLIRDVFDEMRLPAPNEPGIGGTPSNISKAIACLNNNNFIAGNAANFSFNGVWSALNFGPTFIGGVSAQGEGHAWVVDGARTITREEWTDSFLPPDCRVMISTLTGTYTFNYLRFDWGWGPDATINTWFPANVFQASSYDPNFNINVQYISSIQ